jgi:hypothetical protein
MSNTIKRSIVRWIHIVLGIPIIGYIYSPFDQIPNYAPATRFVFVPVLVLSGLWMWKGHVVRRLFSAVVLRRGPERELAGNGKGSRSKGNCLPFARTQHKFTCRGSEVAT